MGEALSYQQYSVVLAEDTHAKDSAAAMHDNQHVSYTRMAATAVIRRSEEISTRDVRPDAQSDVGAAPQSASPRSETMIGG